eukprot:13419597-Ditylum_brightwellii.AAC.1
MDETLPGGSAAPYNLGRVTTHETGHYLGLYHTFENGCEIPGDYIDNTPCMKDETFGCPIDQDSCPSPGVDPIHNFMGFVDDDCMKEFTPDQMARMKEMTAMFKPSLLFSNPFFCLSIGSQCKYDRDCCLERCRKNKCTL